MASYWETYGVAGVFLGRTSDATPETILTL